MICDGAKSSCAMKVATSSSSAVRACLLALNDKVSCNQGLIADDVEESIKNIGRLVKAGMSSTDQTIINIMTDC